MEAHHIRLTQEHLAGNGGLGRYVFLPGDPSRAERISQFFDNVERIDNPRGYHTFVGRLPVPSGAIDVMALPTGIGSASTEVVVIELLSLGAKRLLRVGSCGSMVKELEPGQVVIASGAIRDERTSHHYAPPEYPAVAHPRAVSALEHGARRSDLAGECFLGLCHSKASLYAREFAQGPLSDEHQLYIRQLRACGVIATEMEASTLFVLAGVHGGRPRPIGASGTDLRPQAGAVFAVFGRDDSEMQLDPKIMQLAERRAIEVALRGVESWAELDRS